MRTTVLARILLTYDIGYESLTFFKLILVYISGQKNLFKMVVFFLLLTGASINFVTFLYEKISVDG